MFIIFIITMNDIVNKYGALTLYIAPNEAPGRVVKAVLGLILPCML